MARRRNAPKMAGGDSADLQTNTTASLGPTDISSAATREALSLQVKALSRLHELAMRLASTSEPQPALQAILDTLVDVHNADFGLLSLYDPASGYLLANACVGFDEAALASVARISPTPESGACGSAFAYKTRTIVEDAQAEPQFDACREIARAVGFRGVHSTPILTSAGEVLGILSVHFKDSRLPSDSEIQLADLCARHAADAIV